MNIQQIIKLAKLFEAKYAQNIIPIDPKFQKYINYFLNKIDYKLGYKIAVDGKWGPKTTKALNDINSNIFHNKYQFKTPQDLQILEKEYNLYIKWDKQRKSWETFAPKSQALPKIKAKADQLFQSRPDLQKNGLSIIHSSPGSLHGPTSVIYISSYTNELKNLIPYFKPEIDELDAELKQNNIIMFWTKLYEIEPRRETQK